MKKTLKLNIIKKNRRYFAATQNDYKCKVLIDENSKDLETGEQDIIVEDISIRSRYGTELIYKVAAETTQEKDEKVHLRHHTFNKLLVSKCKELGGIWDSDSGTWVFSDLIEDKVEELDYVFNSSLVNIEIEAKKDIDKRWESVDFLGYPIAKATGRDSGAELGDGVYKIKGAIRSSGSVKNWASTVDEGSVFRLKVPEIFLNEVLEKNKEWEDWPWNVKII